MTLTCEMSEIYILSLFSIFNSPNSQFKFDYDIQKVIGVYFVISY